MTRLASVSVLALAAAITPAFAPVAFAQAPGEDSAVYDLSCDRECLFGFVDQYLAALGAKDPSAAPLADDAVFTENNVILAPGDGLWRTIDHVREGEMRAADPQTGNAAWFGTVQELGNPSFFTMRMKVEDGAIAEVETIVVRMPDAPKPFGDPDNSHAPEWDQVLPEDQRLPRERLQRIADGYFDTVELNDGQIFTAFTDDCGRLENGISTTSGGNGFGAAATASGCEEQFRLGIYRINKRVRERIYPLIDEERGIVVGTGFFDHANWFDRYDLNDGRSMNTALKWPNSISLIEAFRIIRDEPEPTGPNEIPVREGKIQRIEATFTYVPYSMHNVFAYPGPVELPPLGAAPGGAPCDAACLTGLADQYMAAMVDQDPSGVAWADQVHFTENGVPWMIGDAVWGSANFASTTPLVVTDPEAGTVSWFGEVHDHGLPSYYAMTVAVRDGKIAAVDTMAARERSPGDFVLPDSWAPDPVFLEMLDGGERASRADMEALAQSYFAALADGAAPQFAVGCVEIRNGIEAACTGADDAIDRVRDVKIMSVDEARGVVVVAAAVDKPLGDTETVVTAGEAADQEIPYPYSRGEFLAVKIAGGEIVRVEGVSAFLPYGMTVPLAQE
jgi:hypothetical protein